MVKHGNVQTEGTTQEDIPKVVQTEEISQKANIEGRPSLEVRQEAGDEVRNPLEVGQKISDKAGGQDQNLVDDLQDQRPVAGKLSSRPATGLQNQTPKAGLQGGMLETEQLIGEPVQSGKQEVAEKQLQEIDVAQEQVTAAAHLEQGTAAAWGLVTAGDRAAATQEQQVATLQLQRRD